MVIWDTIARHSALAPIYEELEKSWDDIVISCFVPTALDMETKKRLAKILKNPLKNENDPEFVEILDRIVNTSLDEVGRIRVYKTMKKIMKMGGNFEDLPSYLLGMQND